MYIYISLCNPCICHDGSFHFLFGYPCLYHPKLNVSPRPGLGFNDPTREHPIFRVGASLGNGTVEAHAVVGVLYGSYRVEGLGLLSSPIMENQLEKMENEMDIWV